MISLGDIIRLKTPLENDGLPVGAVGTIIECFSLPSEGYEVEFLNEEGYTKAVVTLKPDDFELAWAQH